MVDSQREILAAVRWAVFELTMKLNLDALETNEIDVTESIDQEFVLSAGARVFSYFAPPVSIWIYAAVLDGHAIVTSAMTKRCGQLRYYSFIYDSDYQLDRIEEVSAADERRWMLVITSFSGE